MSRYAGLKSYDCVVRYDDGLEVWGIWREYELEDAIRSWRENPKIVYYIVKYIGRRF